MKRLFWGEKERIFVDDITKELVQEVASQELFYYAISEQYSKTHRIYQEAIKKVVFPPVRIFGMVLWEDQIVRTDIFSVEKSYSIQINFHKKELEERQISPREGDFIEFKQGLFFEIYKVILDKLEWGMSDKDVSVRVECRSARKEQFEVLGHQIVSGSKEWE